MNLYNSDSFNLIKKTNGFRQNKKTFLVEVFGLFLDL